MGRADGDRPRPPPPVQTGGGILEERHPDHLSSRRVIDNSPKGRSGSLAAIRGTAGIEYQNSVSKMTTIFAVPYSWLLSIQDIYDIWIILMYSMSGPTYGC